MRKPLVVGNWKMNKTAGEAASLCAELKTSLHGATGADAAVCPPFTALAAARNAIAGSQVGLGAQDVFWKAKGAYTGGISCQMLLDLGCRYVIVGHSERRGRFGKPDPEMQGELMSVFGDNDATVNRKALACLESGLFPIVCVGENLDEREKGLTDTIVSSQLAAALQGIPESSAAAVTIAYEPVWAIGTGIACEPDEAGRVCGLIRKCLAAIFSPEAAREMRMLYGGSITPENSLSLMQQPDIDGGLVGGASLQAASFMAIIEAAVKAKETTGG